ncbi:DUF4136 domain-containing protein [uncultured Paraglaciecola sp.]|uniref:DUF4136 domain-containing protein n=1 Tax=uncultured Paraglaciecola sp. TaxID=1765024 RepID=UPI002598754F|nr:DUF4136 domain-containing protein [uncultured Paraglaciecola sp.]
MQHRLINTYATLLMTLVSVACAVQPNVFTDSDPQQNFGNYKTFAWANDNPMSVQSDYMVSPFIGAKVMDSIKAEIESKGYQYVEDKADADMSVSFSIGARDKVKVFNDPVVISASWRWGRQYWEPNFNRTTTFNYVKGALAIDVFDTKRKAPVWHGSASKKLSHDEKKGSTESIAPAVKAILSNFPQR